MRESGCRVSVLILLCVSLAGIASGSDCVTAITTVSLPAVFPNLHPVALAWNGSRLGVVKAGYSAENALFFSLYDESLGTSSDDVEIAPAAASVIGLAWNGSEFALLYRDDKLREVLQRIGADGSPAGAAILLGGGHTEQQEYSEFLWVPNGDSGVYAYARTMYGPDTTGIWLSELAPDGTIVYVRNVSRAIFENGATPHIAAATPTRIGVVWTGIRTDELPELHFTSVDTTNSTGLFPIKAFGGRDPRIASDGLEFLVLSVGKNASGHTEMLQTRFSVDGEKTLETQHFMDAPRIDLAPRQLFWRGSEYAFAYDDYFLGLDQRTRTYRLRTFHPDGLSVSDTAFSPASAYETFDGLATIVALDSGYAGALGRTTSPSDGWQSFLARRCPLEADIIAQAKAGVGEIVPLRATASGGTAPYSYFWDFGDGDVGIGGSVTHRFKNEGDYTVKVSVTDFAGTISVARQLISVGPFAPPPPANPLSIALTASATTIAPQKSVAFAVQASGGTPPYAYAWTFGDGTTAAANSPQHSWLYAGTYTVEVVVTDSKNASEHKSVVVNVVPTRKRALR